MDNNSYALYTALRPLIQSISPGQAKEIDALFHQYPDYQWNIQEKNRLRTELYKKLIPLVGAKGAIDLANTLLRLQRI